MWSFYWRHEDEKSNTQENDEYEYLVIKIFCFQSRNHKWASCPEDYDFLRGFYHSNETFLDNIEQALCCRPKTYISRTTDCYLEDVGQKLDTEGWNTCRDWYYMAGVYRGGCNALSCIETLKCCKITAQGIRYH